MNAIKNFLQLYFKDVLGEPIWVIYQKWKIPTASAAVSIIFIPIIISSMISSFVTGKINSYSRATHISISALLMSFFGIILVFSRNYFTHFLSAFVFGIHFWKFVEINSKLGIGQGQFTAVMWALAVDSLPKETSQGAQSLGMWQTAAIGGQIAAATISGLLLDQFQIIGRNTWKRNDVGYIVIFSLASIYFLIGGIFVWRVSVAKKGKEETIDTTVYEEIQ